MHAATGSSLQPPELLDWIVSILRSGSPDAQHELLELLGLGFVDLAGELLQHRAALLAAYEEDQRPVPAAAPAPAPEAPMHGERAPRKRGTVMGSVSTQKHLQEPVRAAGAVGGAGPAAPQQPYLPGVFRAAAATLAPVSSYMNQVALPAGTVRQDSLTWEEFALPYPARLAEGRAASIRIVQIAELDALSQKAFPAYKSLNRMQSAVYHVAHTTNENMLVCAPTGAGKTDVAMLAVLRCILDHTAAGAIRRDAFKVVYVAPMKALAAEVADKFGRRLGRLGLVVREYTGDMQLTRAEVHAAQMIVTTPEKWDVITRKGQGDVDLVDLVKLLIIDEVHLLQDDRGPVLETLVARTLRAVELSQRPVRIVGLSATLPNYVDVAVFLRVNLQAGLFYFDEGFRPVPLSQTLVGVKGATAALQKERLSRVCFERCLGFLRGGHQVMVFVHSRNDTVWTGRLLARTAREEGVAGLLQPGDPADAAYQRAAAEVARGSRNRELQELFAAGLGMHHAGMLRSDRTMVEGLFAAGHIRVLVCTATLAWGVNLPAHAVIIKGTQLFDSQRGGWVRLGVLDVLQIFGRAGRPQYETHGEAVLLTRQADLHHYLLALLSQTPIESRFASGRHLADMLNAELALGTVATVDEAVRWLGYTYLRIRMARNPTAYGLTPKDLARDPELHGHCRRLVEGCAGTLRAAGMAAYDAATGRLAPRDVGRIASHFYLGHSTVELFGRLMDAASVTEESVLCMAAQAAEFEQLRVRPEELEELDRLEAAAAHLATRGLDRTGPAGKAALLIQAWIGRHAVEAFSLGSDLHYVGQNAGRVLRAAWEMAKSQGWARAARACLALATAFERQVWMTAHPLCQVLLRPRDRRPGVPTELLDALQHGQLPLAVLRTASEPALKARLGARAQATALEKHLVAVRRAAWLTPLVEMVGARLYPVSRTGFQLQVDLQASFTWDEPQHGTAELFHVWLEAADGEQLVHRECVQELVVTRETVGTPRRLLFFLAALPPRARVRVLADRWLLPPMVFDVDTAGLRAADEPPPGLPAPLSDETRLLVLSLGADPAALNPMQLAGLAAAGSVLVAAPPGSGLGLVRDVLLLRNRQRTVVWLAPNAALAAAYRRGLARFAAIGVAFAALTVACPASAPDTDADLLVVDDLELLDLAYELAIMRLKARCRAVHAFSGALANAPALGAWLGCAATLAWGVEARCSPLQAQILGFPSRHHGARLASMNKPVYAACCQARSALVWCPSRKQALLTAQALIALTSNDDQPRRFVGDGLQDAAIAGDSAATHALGFGIGIYAGDSPRVLELFREGRLRVLLATVGCVFGLDVQADLVVVKGTDNPLYGEGELPPALIHRMLTHFSTGAPGAAVLLMARDNQRAFYRNLLCEAPRLESGVTGPAPLAELLWKGGRAAAPVEAAVQWLRTEALLTHGLLGAPQYYACRATDPAGRDEFLWQLAQQALGLLADARAQPAPALSHRTVGLLVGGAAGAAEPLALSPQAVLRLLAAAVATEQAETQARALLRAPLPAAREADELRALCAHSQPLQPLLAWFSPAFREDLGDPATKALLALLAAMSPAQLPRHWDAPLVARIAQQCLAVLARIFGAAGQPADNIKHLALLRHHLAQRTVPAAHLPASPLRAVLRTADGRVASQPARGRTYELALQPAGPPGAAVQVACEAGGLLVAPLLTLAPGEAVPFTCPADAVCFTVLPAPPR